MKKNRKKQLRVKDALFTLAVLLAALVINLFIEMFYETSSLIPMISVLGVLIVSRMTQGYLWGILASLISVFAVNYAFTFPYYAFNISISENLFSTVIMMLVAVMTSALTSQIKAQEEIRIEAEREKTRANLLRAISHDLRTPLTSISGSTSTIIENYDSLTKEQHIKLLQEIRSDSEWLIRMVENLLSVTRIDGQKVRVIQTPTVLDELVDATLRKFRKRYPEQKVLVSLPDEFICVLVDPLLIEQVLTNLLENAVMHAVGMKTLSLVVRTTGEYAVFEVIDDGSGIPRERMNNLFTGYSNRPDSPMDGKRSNMGIGLSVCATIIQAHGGKIEAENKPTGGTIIRFTLQMEANEFE